jgi:predicted acylesterase/phospholipase RssA
MTTSNARVFDCLILSGGGAKGAYGAGAAFALFAYYDFKKIEREVCYIGTSAGALSIAALASHGPAELRKLWLEKANSKAVVGKSSFKLERLVVTEIIASNIPVLSDIRNFFSGQKHFTIFTNTRLKKLIRDSVDFDKLADKHIVILTTNFTTGELQAFYSSNLFDEFILEDAAVEDEKERRLAYYQRIDSQDELVSAALASSAIPVFFPPVKIGRDLYVDGGVGNNVPTREAAYFSRFLEGQKKGKVLDVYCVRQDPPGVIQKISPHMGFGEILRGTLNVAQYLHMQPIIDGVNRINREVQRQEEKIAAFEKWINSKSIDKKTAGAVMKQVREHFGQLGGNKAPRISLNLITVQPSEPLGDTLDFNKQNVAKNIKRGCNDMLDALVTTGKISSSERQRIKRKHKV